MNQQQMIPALQLIDALGGQFNQQNAGGLVFEQECHFAKQQITKSDHAMKAAKGSPDALRNAILNVAGIGISLNPALAHAYLVPRSPGRDSNGKQLPPEICLDISYKGLVKLATDSGAIKWAKAELVYEGDHFKWLGMTREPEFEPADPFAARTTLEGLRGAYCVAMLPDGTIQADRVSAAYILKVQASSKAQNGPWKTWPAEMSLKTQVKHASKSWPQGAGPQLQRAIHVINQHEGIEIEEAAEEAPALPNAITAEQLQTIREALPYAGESENDFCRKAGIQSLEALASSRYDGAMKHLNNRIAKLVRQVGAA